MWFILLLLIASTVAVPTTYPTTTTSTVIYDSILGYYCDSDTNCGGLVGNSMCLSNICVCRPGYIPQGNMKCIQEMSMLSLLVFFIDKLRLCLGQ